MIPRPLAPAPVVESPTEFRALEIFFRKTAPQLAGYFEGSFFLGSVLQASLTELAVRQAIAALAVLHEQMMARHLDKRDLDASVPIQLYNRAIRTIVEKPKANQMASLWWP